MKSAIANEMMFRLEPRAPQKKNKSKSIVVLYNVLSSTKRILFITSNLLLSVCFCILFLFLFSSLAQRRENLYRSLGAYIGHCTYPCRVLACSETKIPWKGKKEREREKGRKTENSNNNGNNNQSSWAVKKTDKWIVTSIDDSLSFSISSSLFLFLLFCVCYVIFFSLLLLLSQLVHTASIIVAFWETVKIP